eukprot:COSAG02_NODE_7021_length_3223_cov_3.718630_2_plen_88_part_00
MPLKKAEVTGWCTCSCDGSCSGDAIQTLGEPKSGDPRLATLKPYVVPGGPVCRDCVRGRSKSYNTTTFSTYSTYYCLNRNRTQMDEL